MCPCWKIAKDLWLVLECGICAMRISSKLCSSVYAKSHTGLSTRPKDCPDVLRGSGSMVPEAVVDQKYCRRSAEALFRIDNTSHVQKRTSVPTSSLMSLNFSGSSWSAELVLSLEALWKSIVSLGICLPDSHGNMATTWGVSQTPSTATAYISMVLDASSILL